MRKWGEQLLSIKWLIVNEGVAYKRIINCTIAVELRNKGKYLYKIRCKWENKISWKWRTGSRNIATRMHIL
jgi:hypothetical protein